MGLVTVYPNLLKVEHTLILRDEFQSCSRPVNDKVFLSFGVSVTRARPEVRHIVREQVFHCRSLWMRCLRSAVEPVFGVGVPSQCCLWGSRRMFPTSTQISRPHRLPPKLSKNWGNNIGHPFRCQAGPPSNAQV